MIVVLCTDMVVLDSENSCTDMVVFGSENSCTYMLLKMVLIWLLLFVHFIRCKPTKINVVKLRIDHGGSLLHYPCKLYVDGKVDELNWKWDVDLMLYMEIFEVIKSSGYTRVKCMWYHDLKFSLECWLRPIIKDKDVLKFGEGMKGYDYVDIYVEHIVDEPNIIAEDEVKGYVKAQ